MKIAQNDNYVTAIRDSAIDAYQRIKEIEALDKQLQHIITTDATFARTTETALRALKIMFQFPVINIIELSTQLDKAYNTTHSIIQQFTSLGILREITAQKRNKLYQFVPYLALLEKEY